MAKKTIVSNNHSINGFTTNGTYGFGPPFIGPVLEQKAAALRLTPTIIAERLGCQRESVYRIFKRKHLTVPQMKKWSELLGENLFALYRPNVPQPNEADVLRTKLEAAEEKCEELTNQNGILKNRIIKLEGQKELLEDQVDTYIKRKG